MKVVTPFGFRDSEVIDPRRLNSNFDEVAEVCRAVHNRRFRYWTETFDVGGMVDTDVLAARRFPIACAVSRTAEVVGVELRIFAAGGATWSVNSAAAGIDEFSLLTSSATRAEAAFYQGANLAVSSTPFYLDLSADVASTIVDGQLIVNFRSDKYAQGQTNALYSPAHRFSDADDDDETPLNVEFAAIAAFRAGDAALSRGNTARMFSLKNPVAASTTFVITASKKAATGLALYAAPGTGATATLRDQTGATIATRTIVASGSDAYSRTSFAVTQAGADPTDPASDWTLEIATTASCVAWVFWED